MIENVIQIKSGVTINTGASVKVKKKKKCVWEKDYIWNPGSCSCEYGKHLASIIDDSVIRCDEIIDTVAKWNDGEIKTAATNFNEKKCNL